MHGTTIFVDVLSIGVVAINDDLGPEFAEDAGSGFVRCAMRAVHDDAQSFQGHPAWKRRLGLLDVAAQGVVDANSLADFIGGGADILDVPAEDQALDLILDLIIELVAIGAEEFDAIVVISVMGSGDDDTSISAQAAGNIGDTGSREGSNKEHIYAHRKDPGRNGVLEQ